MKACSRCKVKTDGFSKNSSSPDGYRSICKKCDKIADREKYIKNKETILMKNKEWWDVNGKKVNDERTCRSDYKRVSKNCHLKRVYGITIEEYEIMEKNQDGTCYICNHPEKSRKLAVDHCHTTGQIRGLLCLICNTKLGWYEKNKESINQYLARENA